MAAAGTGSRRLTWAGWLLSAWVVGAPPAALAAPLDVFALREAAANVERQQVPTSAECQTRSACVEQQRARASHERAVTRFMAQWQPALLAAIVRGDEVAEVIWRQCLVLRWIDHAASPSTCDADPARREMAQQRLREIGFEAAMDRPPLQFGPEPFGMGMPELTLHRRMREVELRRLAAQEWRAGVLGRESQIYPGGNSVSTAEDLQEHQFGRALHSAMVIMQRAFTADPKSSLAGLRLVREANQPRLPTWSVGRNLWQSSPEWEMGAWMEGQPDPFGPPENVYLSDVAVPVGGPDDALYHRTLHDVVQSAEQRVDAWLARDRRWSVFLLRRQGHHEWVPEGQAAPLAQVPRAWIGTWRVVRKFHNYAQQPLGDPERMWVRRDGSQMLTQRVGDGRERVACELRLSGGQISAEAAVNAAWRFAWFMPRKEAERFPSLATLPGPAAAFAPLGSRLATQVVRWCREAEWPDNRHVDFFVKQGGTLIQVQMGEPSQGLWIRHWVRDRRAHAAPLLRPERFDIEPWLSQQAERAAAAERRVARLKEIEAQVPGASPQALIDSLTEWRVNRYEYLFGDWPPNLQRLVATPNIEALLCSNLRQHPADAIQRFNLVIALFHRWRADRAHTALVGDCLRFALDDEHPWVRGEALSSFYSFVTAADRPRLEALLISDAETKHFHHVQNLLKQLDR